jgi:hypothetical protein
MTSSMASLMALLMISLIATDCLPDHRRVMAS